MFGHFIAEVRNLKDPWESGRVQLRIYGRHDNEQDIKDEDLPWGMPLQPITSAATNRIGTSPTGVLVGSRVYGTFLDEAQQYPIILGTFARAGKLKDEEDNTGGKDDIDEAYSDVPIGALASTPDPKTATQGQPKKKKSSKPKYDVNKEPKYNKNDHVKKDEGNDAIKDAKEAFSKMYDKATVGSLEKGDVSDILKKILKVDPQNDAGGLPMAPQMFQQIIQMGNMGGIGGITSMLGGGMGMSLGGIAGGLGIGNVLGSLSGMLGIDISMLSGMTGMIGGMGMNSSGQGSGQGGYLGNSSGQYYASQVPTTKNDIAITTAELLNQLGGYKTPTNTIAGLSIEDKEGLYLAILQLMNSVNDELYVNTSINVYNNNHIEYVTSNTTMFDSSSNGTIILPGYFTSDVTLIPNHYIPVYYFTDVDPYPGYMEWESLGATADIDPKAAFILQNGTSTYLPVGTRVFCPRPYNRPYAATPEEDNINAVIFEIINELLILIKENRLTITNYLDLSNKAKTAANNQSNQNSNGKNTSSNNNMMRNMLGMLGGLLDNMELLQLAQSVLEKGDISQIFQDFQKKNVQINMKKKLAKQAVGQKNELQNLLNNNMLNFGNIPKGNSSGGGGNKGQTQGSPTGGTNSNGISNNITYITKTGNNVSYGTVLNPDSTVKSVTFGYYTISKAT